MPAVKKSRKMVRKSFKKPFYKRKTTVSTIHAKRFALAPRRVELKSSPVSPSPVFSTTGAFDLLNGLAEGDAISNRDGRRVALDSVQIKIAGTQSGTGTQLDNIGRLIVLYDRKGVTAPAITDVLQSAVAIAGYASVADDRFVVLYDKLFPPENDHWEVNIAGTWTCTIDLDLTGFKTHYIGTGATITDLGEGALWLFSLGNAASGASNNSLVARSVLRYHEI